MLLYGVLLSNLGLAIVALTIIVRVFLLPVTVKQLWASRDLSVKMRDLQPKVQALKARFAKDRRKLNEETVALYKKAGVNPLGCLSGPMLLPMIVQMPVWIGLYRAIMISTDPVKMAERGYDGVSHAFLWLNLGTADPFYILPILVALTMWISQEIIRVGTGDPQQETMNNVMRFSMPILFGVIVINLPSGLSLYWVVSSFIQILTEYPIFGWRGSKVAPAGPVVPNMKTLGPDVDKTFGGRKAPLPGKHMPPVETGRFSRQEERQRDGAVDSEGQDSGGSGTTGSGPARPRPDRSRDRGHH